MDAKKIKYEGFWYEYEYRLAKHRKDVCLATENPQRYCNGYYLYSDKDPGSGMAFVIINTNNPEINIKQELTASEYLNGRSISIAVKGSSYVIGCKQDEIIKLLESYHQAKSKETKSMSDEYIRDAIGIVVDQTRFHDVRLDHILKQKEQLTDELVKVFKQLNEG